jgi:hypothetical protein
MTIQPIVAVLALTGLSMVVPVTADAQSNALQRRLAAATRIDCRFTTLVNVDWKDGTEAKVGPTEFEMGFFDIDVGEGTAEAEGRFGASFIVVRYSEGYLHFMQMSNAGPLHLTTVLAQESTDGRMKAVHTRHEYSPTALPGFTSRPEMYVGDCAVTAGSN